MHEYEIQIRSFCHRNDITNNGNDDDDKSLLSQEATAKVPSLSTSLSVFTSLFSISGDVDWNVRKFPLMEVDKEAFFEFLE